MRTVSIFIPGRFEDAFLYFGRLVALTENQSLRFYNMERLVDSLEKQFPDAIPLLTWLFVRNDWLASGQFKSLMQSPELRRGFCALFDLLPNPCIHPLAEASEESEEDLGVNATVILDLRVYNQRIYIGADSGLFHCDYQWSGDTAAAASHTEKRLDARCLSISARFGAVNASCGEDGLFTSFDDFPWQRETELPKLRRLADRSLRTAWLQDDLVNYRSYGDPLLLKGRQEEVEETRYREKKMIVSLGDQIVPLFEILREQAASFGFDETSVQFAFNSGNTVFLQTVEGHFYSIGLRSRDEGYPEVRFIRDYEYPGGRILAGQFSRLGVVVEADDRVILFSKGEWVELIRGEVLSVRAFAGSRRYQNVVSVVREDGIYLIGIVDENAL